MLFVADRFGSPRVKLLLRRRDMSINSESDSVSFQSIWRNFFHFVWRHLSSITGLALSAG
jgi:hypothetical protein